VDPTKVCCPHLCRKKKTETLPQISEQSGAVAPSGTPRRMIRTALSKGGMIWAIQSGPAVVAARSRGPTDLLPANHKAPRKRRPLLGFRSAFLRLAGSKGEVSFRTTHDLAGPASGPALSLAHLRPRSAFHCSPIFSAPSCARPSLHSLPPTVSSENRIKPQPTLPDTHSSRT